MNKINQISIAAILICCICGCTKQQHVVEPAVPAAAEEAVHTIKVEKDGISDYIVRGTEAVVEAGQDVHEAGTDAYRWLKEKKDSAREWIHKKTEEEKDEEKNEDKKE